MMKEIRYPDGAGCKMNRGQDGAEKAVTFIRLGRPLVLVAGIIAYALGMSMAFYELGYMDWGLAALGLLIMSTATFMAHYANEYADLDTDSITRRTMFSGGSGVLPAGLLQPNTALNAALAFMAVSAAVTLVGIWSGVLAPIVGIIVMLGILGGWFYSMPPLRLERTWFGELDNSLLGGFLMPLIAFACIVGYIASWAVLACVPVFLAVLANLIGVHWLDRKADETVGKRSLVVRLGERSIVLHGVVMLLTYIIIVAMAGGVLPREVVLMALLTIPLALLASVFFERLSPLGLSSVTMGALMIAMSIGFLLAS
jgi:1,4-dihydroxy-2-naphthoate octaprenyltransferase